MKVKECLMHLELDFKEKEQFKEECFTNLKKCCII